MLVLFRSDHFHLLAALFSRPAVIQRAFSSQSTSVVLPHLGRAARGRYVHPSQSIHSYLLHCLAAGLLLPTDSFLHHLWGESGANIAVLWDSSRPLGVAPVAPGSIKDPGKRSGMTVNLSR